jgi:hypothetical protein
MLRSLKSRKIQWLWNAARLGQARKAYKFVTEKELEGKYYDGS